MSELRGDRLFAFVPAELRQRTINSVDDAQGREQDFQVAGTYKLVVR